jgi:hypothetical protein
MHHVIKKYIALNPLYTSVRAIYSHKLPHLFCSLLLMAAGLSLAQERRVTRIPTPWTEDGQAVMLELVA